MSWVLRMFLFFFKTIMRYWVNKKYSSVVQRVDVIEVYLLEIVHIYYN